MLKKRIPTIVGIFLLLIGITAGVYLVELGPQPLTTRANPSVIPAQVRISNISHDSFSVSWYTESAVLGFVRYGTTPTTLTLTALDDRDQAGGTELAYTTHHVTVAELSPQTMYYFQIISGSDSSVFDDNGQPYSAQTGTALSPNVSVDSANGSIIFPDLTPAEGVLIYLSLEGGLPISVLTTSSGGWSAPVSTIRVPDLSAFLSYDASQSAVSIEALGPDGSVATARVLTGNDTPVPQIVLGEIYDFTQAQIAESQFSFEPLPSPPAPTEVITVHSPEEGEAINTQQPEFIGDGPPHQLIKILVESSEPVEAQVTVGANGQWSWTPSSPLAPGEHLLTLRWLDENGVLRTITRRFVVYAQGESNLPAFEATPSATGTPTPTATPTPVQLAQVSPTPTPTPRLQATPTPTATAIPSTPSAQATEPALPAPGSGGFTLGLALLSLLFIVSGSFLLAFRRFL